MEKTFKQIREESDSFDWDTAQREGIKNRDQFLELFPKMKDWLEQGEKINGQFIGINSLSFTDGRCVLVYKWEQTYTIDFHNPNNKEGLQETSVNLSYEAMNGFLTLYKVFQTDEDSRRFWTAIGIKSEEVEEYLAEKSEV